MSKYHEIKAAALAALLLPAAAATAQSTRPAAPAWDTYADTWVATDGLGRALPTFEQVGPPKPNKTVVMFYYLWMDGRGEKIYDMAKLQHQKPGAVVGPGEWWWWGEPLLGYYRSTDPFVCRVHASQLADAGVDTLAFDTTNGYTHEPQYLAVCKALQDGRDLGLATPDLFHVTHNKPRETVQKLYDDFYGKDLYPDLWFRWMGKPLVLTDPDQLTPQLRDAFTTRQCWAYSDPKKWFGNGRDKWTWLDHYPQQAGWHDDPNLPEELSVSAAQHAHTLIGRSFHDGKEPPADQRKPAEGLYFAEQWKRALEVSPEVVFVTNYNEWIAKAYPDPGRVFMGRKMQKGDGFFVDEYDPEFSRDIEPAMPTAANQGVDDNYYYQFVANVRKYKGVRPLPAVKQIPIAIDGQFADWQAAAPEFRDTLGDPVERDFDGFATGTRYVNHTGRNDIAAAKVSYDAQNVYFYVRTRGPLSPATDDDWMVLYLDTDQNATTGWLGYDFAINRTGVGPRSTRLEANTGGKDVWRTINPNVKFEVAGNEMEIAIPLASLGGALPTGIDFKWADHCHAAGDWTDFTLNGDAAPNARFNYRAKLSAE